MALYLVIQVGAFLSTIIPRSWRYLIGTAVGDLIFLVWRSKRSVLLDNMATVLAGSPRDAQVRFLAKRSMRNYCKYLIEFLELPVMDESDPIVANMTIRGVEHLVAALEHHRGVILTSPHYGSIEVPGLKLRAFTDFHAVYDPFDPPYLDRLIQRTRLQKGMGLIPVTNVRAMLRVLSAGGALALLFDRPVERSKGVPVTFFGRETAVPGGPAALAMKTGATLLPVYSTREPDRSFIVRVLPPITWTASGDRDRDAQSIMQKLMNTMQTAVRERPDQWYMFRPMWPEAGDQMPVGNRGAAPGDPAG